MKSLNELINEVKNSVKGTSARYSSLVKLGLRPVEVTEIINGWRQEEREERLRAAVKYTFGIELEVVGVYDQTRMVCEAASRGLHASYERYNHTDNSSYFKFVPDGSIATGIGGIECVSPILNEGAQGDQAVKGICEALQAAGARPHRSCGYHVHVGGPITGAQYVNVFKNYQKLEADIDLHMAPSRRYSQWCQGIARFDYSTCSTPGDVTSAMHGRYYKVNPDAWWRHHTIEFRQHQATVNAKKVQMWAAFCIKLVAWSRDHVLTETTTVADAPFLTRAEKRWWAARKTELNGQAQPQEEMAY